MMVYVKMVFKRPPIEESAEMQKKVEELKEPPPVLERVNYAFEKITVNIATTSGKSHYATLEFTVECADEATQALVKGRKAQYIDEVIAALAKKQITELNTIQGKLILKTELLKRFNELSQNERNKPPKITDMFFSSFILQ